MSEENIINLDKVIYEKGILKNLPITKVELRGLRPKDFYGLDFANPQKQVESMTILISRLSGLNKKLIEELDYKDFTVISDRVSRMMV